MQISGSSYRLYSCACCAQQVRICRQCDRGNQYCAQGCAKQRRRQSVHRAGRRYQRSRRGARLHAARQRCWRARAAQKVTHQGSDVAGITSRIVALDTASWTLPAHAPDPPDAPSVRHCPPAARAISVLGVVGGEVRRSVCGFCGRALPTLTRLGPLRGGP